MEDLVEGSDNDTGNTDERGPSNVEEIMDYNLDNEHLFDALRLTTIIGAALALEAYCCNLNLKMVDLKMKKTFWLALQSKYQNKPRPCRRTLLRRLDNSVMKANTDPDLFMYQINELSDLDEMVFTERLTTIILDALPADQ